MDSYPSAPPPSPSPPREAVRRWWRPGVVVGGLVVLLVVVWGVPRLFGGGAPGEEPVRGGGRSPEVTGTVSVAPRPTGPPVLVGRNMEEAKAAASAAGYSVVSHDASDRDDRQWDADGWTVCFQASAGRRDGGRPVLDLGVVRVGAPCPAVDGGKIPWPAMPAVTGMAFARAGQALAPVGFRKVVPESAYSDVALPGVADPWKVCFQDPEPGETVEDPQFGTAYLKLAPPDAPCPERPYATLRP